MFFSSISLNGFRNFSEATIDLDSRCNIFYGQNGAGKTTILEAIHYLTLGKSFRTHLIRRIIKNGASEFVLFGKIDREDSSLSVGIKKSIECGKEIKVGGNAVDSNIEITKLLPLQLLNHDSYLLLYDRPSTRRQFIDWGLFHVKPSFLELWRKGERILKQRNTAIRDRSRPDYIKMWDEELATIGCELHNLRSWYISNLINIAENILNQLLPGFKIAINYYPGWNLDFELLEILSRSFSSDLALGYTNFGAHRADLKITANNVPAKDALSRGQQKLLIYGLQIAQGILINQLNKKPSIYLVDDLLAELDLLKSTLLIDMLLTIKSAQLMVTGLDLDGLKKTYTNKLEHHKLFYIENGTILN